MQIQAGTNPLTLPLEVVVVKDRPSRDDAGREVLAVHDPQVAVNALFAIESLPENRPRLYEDCLSCSVGTLPAEQGNDGIYLTGDALFPNPCDARIQTETVTEKRNTSPAEGILNGIDEYARTRVAECALSTFGVVVINGGWNTAAIEGRLEGAARRTVARMPAPEHAAPQTFELLRRTHKQRFVRLRRGRQPGNREQ